MISRRHLVGTAVVSVLAGTFAARAASQVPVTDTHVHLFGPHDRYPLVAERPYRPELATVADLAQFNAQHGISRSVIVQPSFYGTDNRLLVDALTAIGPMAAGVAVIAPDVADAVLVKYRAARVRGVRLNLETGGTPEPATAAHMFDALVARLTGTGLHLQLFARLGILDGLARRLASCPVPLVIDHFGFPPPGTAADDPAFGRLVALVGSGRAHVKLSAPWRIGGQSPGFETLRPLALALAEAAPDRILWGSDWPHTQRADKPDPEQVVPFAKRDVAGWMAALAGWLGPERWAKAADSNPGALYFGS